MATSRSLKSARDALVLCYAANLLDDIEFAVLYDMNESREIFPYWKFQEFDLDTLDEAECRTELRFSSQHIYELARLLGIPARIVTPQRITCSGIEALCIMLKRLAYPCRYSDMVPFFGRDQTELCIIFNYVLNFLYNNHHHRLESWNQWFLQPRMLQLYAQTIHDKGAPLHNCFGYIDGTVIPICRPKLNQRVVYNGHKRLHALKFQSIALPNGLIGNLAGPFEGRRHDSTMLYESSLLQNLQRVAFHNGQPLCVYGDPAYPLNVHLQAPFQTANITPDQQMYNKAMSKVRISVEWLFGDVRNYFKFVDYKKGLKLGLSPIGKFYIVSALLQNAHTCLYGNIVSEYFDLRPPTLQEYFQ